MSVEDISRFSAIIEVIAATKNIGYMDAVVLYCETNDCEIETAASLISTVLKSKIKAEAEELHFLKPSKTTKLPI